MKYPGIFEKERISEDFVYRRVSPNISLKRMKLEKQKKMKKKARMLYQDYNFLQFVPVVRTWAQRNFDLTLMELDVLMFMYPIGVFSSKEFNQCLKEMGRGSPAVLANLRDKGWITPWAKEGNKNYYTLSQKASDLISRYHRICILEEEIPMSERRNVIVRSKDPKDQELAELFRSINDKVKKNVQQ